MGNCVGGFSRRTENLPFRRKKPKKTITIAFLGLDGAGKTTILKALQNEDASSVHSTMGFSRGEFAIRKSPIVAFDLGGAPRIRDIWKIYYAEIFAVVYVVDSSAQSRMQENKEVLRTMRGHRQLMGKPILFLLNKKDLPDAVDELQFSEDMDLHNMAIESRTDIRVERVCAVKGVGRDIDPLISEGLEWLLDRVYSRFDQLNQGIEAAEQALRERQARERLERQHRLASLSKQHAEDRPGPSTAPPESVEPTTNRDTLTIDRSEHSQPNGSIPTEVLDVQNLVSVVPPKKSRILEENLTKNEEISTKIEKGRVNEAFEEEKMEPKEERRESRATKSSSGRETAERNSQNHSVKNFKSKVAPNGFVVTDRSHSTTASANFHLFEITSDGRRKPASSPLRRFQSAHFDKDHVFFKPAPKTKLLMQNEPIAPNSDLDRTDLSPNSNSKPGNTEQNWSY